AIHDVQGRTVGFGGRVLPGNSDARAAKYINSPDSQIFTKSDHLFGLDLARDTIAKDRHVVIVEGYTDVMMARQHGLHNVVAVLGTALGERHVGLLKRFADRVTLVLDGDEAGQRRSTEILELFVQGAIDLRIATLPDGLDPCDLISQRGADAFSQAVDGAVDALEHKIRTALTGIDPRRDMHASNKALEEILRTISKQNPSAQTTASEQQLRIRQLLGQISRRFRIDENDLRERLRALRAPQETPPQPASPAAGSAIHDWEDELFGILLKFPQLAANVLSRVREEDLQSPASHGLLAAYRQLVDAEKIPDFDSLILVLEERLKSILVGIDERASKRSLDVEGATTAMEATVAAFERKRDDAEYQSQVEELNSDMNEAEQLAAFHRLLEAQRTRRGISTPTDG
ncbi:MAG: toprim domain-containing protein, partial [Planctomycetota bacterium]